MAKSFLLVHGGHILAGHYLCNIHAARYGGLVAIRTASQGTNFPINGSPVLPTFGTLKSAFTTTNTTIRGNLQFKRKKIIDSR